MAHITVVGGAGYVGISYSVLLSELGHHVIGLDTDPRKVALLSQGLAPIHEPGLQPLLEKSLASGRLSFTSEVESAIATADFVLICVGTPSAPSGAADTTAVAEAARIIALSATGHTIVINKSTMPVGSNGFVANILAEHGVPGTTFDVVSNPEFLREGAAIFDIFHPSRIVLGSDNPDAAMAVAELFADLHAPLVFTDPRSAEMVKYASNAFLATKISFINEIAAICEHLDADVSAVVEGMSLDPRIGPRFLHPGAGFGGSCFPKDVRALAHMARESGYDTMLLTAVLDINRAMRDTIRAKLERHLGDLSGKTIALLGLAFKPETDDIREAPAVALIGDLLEAGARIRATDPVAIPNARAIHPDATYTRDAYSAAMGADAVVLTTEWNDYRHLDPDRLAHAMRGRLVIDGRNALDPHQIASSGLFYEGIGRRPEPRAEPAGARHLTHIRSVPAPERFSTVSPPPLHFAQEQAPTHPGTGS